jgi:hypothetical protein
MDELEARIEALERAVTEGDHDLSELATEGETRERLAAVEAELGDLADRVAELEAATQALRGYAGNVRAVNRDVEQRADAALAKAESLESAIADGAETTGDRHGRDDGDRERATSNPPGSAGPGPTGHSPEPPAGVNGETRSDGQTRETRRDTGVSDSPTGNTRGETGVSDSSTGNTRGETGVSDSSTGNTRGDTGVSDSSTGSTRGDASGHGRCRACGRPTGADTVSGDDHPASPGVGTDSTDDPLDGVFEADGGRETGEDGTFDRIRKML